MIILVYIIFLILFSNLLIMPYCSIVNYLLNKKKKTVFKLSVMFDILFTDDMDI